MGSQDLQRASATRDEKECGAVATTVNTPAWTILEAECTDAGAVDASVIMFRAAAPRRGRTRTRRRCRGRNADELLCCVQGARALTLDPSISFWVLTAKPTQSGGRAGRDNYAIEGGCEPQAMTKPPEGHRKAFSVYRSVGCRR